MTIKQYLRLEKQTEKRLKGIVRRTTIELMTKYSQQTDFILSVIESWPIPMPVKMAMEELAKLDLMLDSFNLEYEEDLRQMSRESVEEGYRYIDAVAIPTMSTYNPASISLTTQGLTSPLSGFNLREAVWTKARRARLFLQIMREATIGKSTKDTITRVRETLSRQGKVFSRSTIETEVRRGVQRGTADAMRINNRRYPDDPLVYTWSLSPLHAVYDICDLLVGDYDAEHKVPQIPHPNCRCRVTVRRRSDIEGKLRRWDGEEYTYKGQKSQLY